MEFVTDEGLWLKGCLHCHSTVSDGRLSPSEVVGYYESRGYRLLSLTDHEKIVKVEGFKGVSLAGVELPRGRSRLGESYHLMVLGVQDPSILTAKDAQTVIDEAEEMGGLTYIAHPYWSNLVHEDLVGLEGYVGLEVYNTGCDMEVAKGYGSMQWDGILSSHRLVRGFASDDAHRYTVYPIDADGGWIWVRVDEETPDAVLKALKEGAFYSSMGPRISLFSFSSCCLEIESTPVSRVDTIAPNGTGLSLSAEVISKLSKAWMNPLERRLCEEFIVSLDCLEEGGEPEIFLETKNHEKLTVKTNGDSITRFELRKDFKYPYLRVELADGEGRHAWLNPILPS